MDMIQKALERWLAPCGRSATRLTPDRFLKHAFGLDEDTHTYYGGGNIKDKGGFQIPLGFLSQHADRKLLYRMTYEIVQGKFLEAIGRQG